MKQLLNMKQLVVNVGDIKISNTLPFVLFGGMNVLESRDIVLRVCEHYVNITQKLNIPYIFKASFDKANRSSVDSYRGIGLDKSMKLFQELKKTFGVKIITDIHESNQAEIVSNFVDILQLPAFLARQTDLIISMARTGCAINIKKPQYINPMQIGHVVDKFRKYGNNNIILCDRGTNFGYDNLIVDMLGFNIMNRVSGGCPIIFDVTHSLQMRDSFSFVSGGRSERIYELARSGMAIGIAGLFLEAHPNPKYAKCDGPSALLLDQLEDFLQQIKSVDDLVKDLLQSNNQSI